MFKNAPAGMLYPGDTGFELSNNSVYQANWLNLGPRLGLAWDVEGNGRMSVRASYGLTYDEFPLQMRQGNSIGQPPWGSETIVDSPVGGLDDPWQGVPGGNPFPAQLTVDAPFPPLGVFQAQREIQRLEFRAEAYNLTNSFRPGNPSTILNESTFGQIRSSDTPRIMQFALKYAF